MRAAPHHAVMILPTLACSLFITFILIVRNHWVSDQEHYWASRFIATGRVCSSKSIPARPSASRGAMNRNECSRHAAIRQGHTPTPSYE